MAVSVYVLDDHDVVRQGVRRIIEDAESIEVVGTAGTAAAGMRGIIDLEPDVALVDLRLPDGTGVEVVRWVRDESPATGCILFTSFSDETAFFQAVVAGASGYVMKDADPPDLVEAIRRVARGESLIDQSVLDDLRSRTTTIPDGTELFAYLTVQEKRVLEDVTSGATNREIAVDLDLSEKTVRNYVSSILTKLGMRNRTQLAAHVARTIEGHRNA